MAHVRARPQEIAALKRGGAKVIGFVPNGYVPEELLYASGAIPVGLLRGGDHEAVARSETTVQRFCDTFCRAHVGYRLLNREPLYQLPDAIIVAYTDRNVFTIGELWRHYTDVPVIKLDVPRYNRAGHAFDYYLEGLRTLKLRLEELTGHEITPEALNQEIEVSNRIRRLLAEIGMTRKAERPPISGRDFVLLNHATLYADRSVLVRCLEAVRDALRRAAPVATKGPRVLLTGATLAEGDYAVIDLLEECGARVVIEEFEEGVRHYNCTVGTGREPLEALADRYLRRRPPPAFFKMVTAERFDYLLGLAREYHVDGVVWYALMFRDAYEREAVMFHDFLQKHRIPFLKLNSDFTPGVAGLLRTRVEAFVESLRTADRS